MRAPLISTAASSHEPQQIAVIWVIRDQKQTWAEMWPALRRY
jgi:hypothetical protein